MDSKTFNSVTVFNIDNDGKLVNKYADNKCQITCTYDPSGISVRIIVPGKFDSSRCRPIDWQPNGPM